MTRTGGCRITGRSTQADPTQDDRDRYGRLLRHVVMDDGRVAPGVLIAAGLATEYTYDRPYRYRDDFVAAQAEAQDDDRGIWGGRCAGRRGPSAGPETTRAHRWLTFV